MKIKDLSPELQELVHKRQREQGNDGTFDGSLSKDKNEDNFNWLETIEGNNFWSDVDEGKSMIHSKFYPKGHYEIY